MCNKLNLPERVRKAVAAQRFAKIINFDSDGKPSIILVPGTEAKQYAVKLYRHNGFLEATCENVTGPLPVQCISHARVACYHTMAACQVAAGAVKMRIAWGANRDDADRLNRIHHGTLFSVTMRATGYTMYGVSYE